MKKTILIMMFLLSPLANAGGKEFRVKVDGMTCPSCAAFVESHLKKLDAVDSVSISLGKGIAVVTLSEDKKIKKGDIKKAVKDAGFKVTEVNGLPSP